MLRIYNEIFDYPANRRYKREEEEEVKKESSIFDWLF
jgi:hypothetical protein